MRALVVTGDAAEGRAIALMLEAEGIAAVHAKQADEAATLLRRMSVELLIVSVRLPPPLSGPAFLHLLRGQEIDTPALLLLDGGDEGSDLLERAERGRPLAQSALVRPFDLADLLNAIEEALEHRASLPPELAIEQRAGARKPSGGWPAT